MRPLETTDIEVIGFSLELNSEAYLSQLSLQNMKMFVLGLYYLLETQQSSKLFQNHLEKSLFQEINLKENFRIEIEQFTLNIIYRIFKHNSKDGAAYSNIKKIAEDLLITSLKILEQKALTYSL